MCVVMDLENRLPVHKYYAVWGPSYIVWFDGLAVVLEGVLRRNIVQCLVFKLSGGSDH